MMNTLLKYQPYPCLLAFLLAACGGGGGGGTAVVTPPPLQATASPTPASISTLSSLRSSGTIPSTFRELTTLAVTPLQDAARRLPISSPSDPVYLKVWFTDPVSGEVSLLALGRYQDGVPLRVQVPAGVQLIQFEIYNIAGNVSGQWSLS